MIKGVIKNWQEQTPKLGPLFEKAFTAITELLAGLPPDGKIEVQGDDLFIIVQRYTTRPVEQAEFEAHQKYADIQFVVEGAERVGVLPVNTLTLSKAYNASKDCAFYHKPEREFSLHPLGAGEFMVFLPEDAHMPCCHPLGDIPGQVTKMVAKVRVR